MHGKNRTTGTSFGNEFGKISSPISDKRCSFFSESGDHHLTDLTGWNRLKCFRIEKFENVIVCPVMDTFMMNTIETCARTVEFCQAGNIEDMFYP
jgi:hypothetical protein